MNATLFVVTMFVLRLGVPAFILLGLGEIVRHRLHHLVSGGD